MRHSTRYRLNTFFSSGNFPNGVKWLLISNTAVFLLSYLAYVAGLGNIFGPFALVPRLVVYHFAIWELATYLFLHGGVMHLLFNMLTLWMFGVTLERDWGTRKFLKYYFLCGIGAGLCDVTVNALLGNWNTSTIGASGAIFGVLLAFGVMYPEATILFLFLFPIQAKYFVIFGLIYLKVRFPKVDAYEVRRWYRNYKLQRAKKKFQVYMRKHGSDRGPWVN
jgi:membrane associated rhomboid family serine protease